MTYAIYQLKKENVRKLGFLDLDEFRAFSEQEGAISLNDYDLVQEVEIIYSKVSNVHSILNNLFELYNIDIPEGFKGRSMSMSDIVRLDKDYYYCDLIGFTKIQVKEVK